MKDKGENLMKKKVLIVGLLVFALTLVFATEVALADPDKTVGERLNLYDGPVEFPAGQPFFCAWILSLR